ncbi:DUF4767 domain-containing protein [Isobaculum melis]|uniref:DUF4767 domain-containing protein n=1 Tax=Isobaculum melis TaxID=142588 RepID=A0A1H9TTS6_9LACT|nr:DUF4767 domain-containing protein [Isobaculum melis]SES00387.1 protein of unknown function [Isobaculum melis]
MKKLIIGVSLFLLIGITGCSSNDKKKTDEAETSSQVTSKEYDAAMKKGKEALIDKNMTKAISAFQMALKYKEGNKEAEALIVQAKLYRDGVFFNEKKEYAKAIDRLEALADTKDGSPELKQYAKELKKEITQLVIKESDESKKEAEKAKQEKEAEKAKAEEQAKIEAPEPATNGTYMPWNSQKKIALAAYMNTWGQKMGQSYIEYSPGADVNFYGVNFPSTFAQNNIAVNGARAAINWSGDGTGNNVYNVVAIYSDVETTTNMERHLYLFTLVNGQPMVLITMQNQGNAENLIYFTETQNTELRNGFAQIIAE